MTDTLMLPPQGISHTINLDALSPVERRKHHTRQLRTIALYQGIDGVKAYKAQHPDAAPIRIQSAPVAYVPKPAGYGDAMASLVAGWFTSDTALRQTNRADVARLNDRLATDRFDPDRHFSNPLSPAVRRKIAAVFADHGEALDPAKPITMTAVRKAVANAKAGEAGGEQIGRFGGILRVACKEFPIRPHGGHECIRINVSGKWVRLRLDALLEFLALTGLGNTGGLPDYLLHSNIREPVQTGQTAPADPLEFDVPPRNLSNGYSALLSVPEEPVQNSEHLPLSDRIRRLRQLAPEPNHDPNGPDPLALI